MEKELVYVDKNLVGKLDILQDICRIKGEDIDKIIERLKGDDNDFLANIDDSLIEIKCHAKRVRDEYKKCVDEEIEKSNTLWEECDNKLNDSRTKIKKVTDLFYNCKEQINSLSEAINSIPFYKLNTAIDVFNKFNDMTDSEKEMIKILLNNKE